MAAKTQLTVVNTRTPEQAEPLSSLLLAEGVEVFEFPCLKIIPSKDWQCCTKMLESLGEDDWIVFTSANGIRHSVRYLESCESRAVALRKLFSAKWAAIGERTAARAREYSKSVDFVAAESNSEGFSREFVRFLTERRETRSTVVLLRGRIASKTLPDALRLSCPDVHSYDVYDSVLPEIPKESLKSLERLVFGRENLAFIFMSSQAAINFMSILSENGLEGLIPTIARKRAIVVGPKTAKKAAELGFLKIEVASEPSEKSIVFQLLNENQYLRLA